MSASSQSEVTDFQVAIGVEEKVGWLQISVDDYASVPSTAANEKRTLGGMKGFHCATGLVQEVLTVIVAQILRANHTMQIGLQKLLYKVH